MQHKLIIIFVSILFIVVVLYSMRDRLRNAFSKMSVGLRSTLLEYAISLAVVILIMLPYFFGASIAIWCCPVIAVFIFYRRNKEQLSIAEIKSILLQKDLWKRVLWKSSLTIAVLITLAIIGICVNHHYGAVGELLYLFLLCMLYTRYFEKRSWKKSAQLSLILVIFMELIFFLLLH